MSCANALVRQIVPVWPIWYITRIVPMSFRHYGSSRPQRHLPQQYSRDKPPTSRSRSTGTVAHVPVFTSYSRLEKETMHFTKMHGLGNDYIYVNGFEEQLTNPAAMARAVSDRHFGI